MKPPFPYLLSPAWTGLIARLHVLQLEEVNGIVRLIIQLVGLPDRTRWWLIHSGHRPRSRVGLFMVGEHSTPQR